MAMPSLLRFHKNLLFVVTISLYPNCNTHLLLAVASILLVAATTLTMVFMMDDDVAKNPYLQTAVKQGNPPMRIPNIHNLDNPYNRAPSAFIATHIPTSPPRRRKPSKMPNLGSLDTATLISTALGPSILRPKLPAKSTPATSATAHVTRKRAWSIDDFFEEEEEAEDDEEEEPIVFSRKKSARHSRASANKAPTTPSISRNCKISSSHSLTKVKDVPESLKKKAKATPVPRNLDEASEADRMMFRMRVEGKGWETIRQKWQEMTGISVGRSTLSVRYIKLTQNIADDGGAEDLALLRFKKEAEAELQDELWRRVAEKINQESEIKHTAQSLRKRFKYMEKKKHQVPGGKNQLTITNGEVTDEEDSEGDTENEVNDLLGDTNDEEHHDADAEPAGSEDCTLPTQKKATTVSAKTKAGAPPNKTAKINLFGLNNGTPESDDTLVSDDTPHASLPGLAGYTSNEDEDADEEVDIALPDVSS